MKVFERILLIVGVLLFLSRPVLAENYYVAPGGNDGNAGTNASSPWKTIGKANATLRAGDTVYIRGGEYQESIDPDRSGAPGQYITYQAYNGETPILTNQRIAIVLDNRSYIRVSGIKVDGKKSYPDANVDEWVSLRGTAHHNTVENSIFNNANGWSGVRIEGHHNEILNNVMDNLGSMIRSSSSNETGDMINIKPSAEFNLVEGNTLTRGGHNLILCEGSHNVIRNNDLDNEWGENTGYRTLAVVTNNINLGRNVIEGNILRNTHGVPGGRIATAVKVEGAHQIFRNNIVFNNGAESIRGNSRQDPDGTMSMYNRIYSNTIYDSGGPGFALISSSDYDAIDYNVFKNNIVYKSRQNPDSSSNDSDIFISLPAASTSLANNEVIANAILKDNAGDAMINAKGLGGNSLRWFETNYPANFNGNISDDPGLAVGSGVPQDAADFQLRESSSLIDKGAFLTETRSAGSGRVIPVKDSGYFTDGFGLVTGDIVKLRSTGREVMVTAVDYEKHEITVAEDISWTKDDGIALRYNGNAPDIGASEYGLDKGGATKAPPSPPIFL